MAKTTTSKAPSMLSISRGISPGHFLMFSAQHGATARTPILIRKETAIGPIATHSSKEDDMVKGVPARLESACLAPGDDTLVLTGTIRVASLHHRLTACNSREFRDLHGAVMTAAATDGVTIELARRYAITLLAGQWGWRNSDNASEVSVEVAWEEEGVRTVVQAKDLLLSKVDTFAIAEYPEHAQAIERLAKALEAAMVSDSRRAVTFEVSGTFLLGAGCIVYPSQEWADEDAQAKNGTAKADKHGLSRILAKLQLPDGSMQAFMTERKIGNQLRRIDTWYPGATPAEPIAVEGYGASIQEARALRSRATDSIFGLVKKVAEAQPLDAAELHYYTAMVMRGGVFSSKD